MAVWHQPRCSDAPSSRSPRGLSRLRNLPSDLLDALIGDRFLAGTHPHARSASLQRLRPEATLVPPGSAVIRSAHLPYRRVHLAQGHGWLLVASRWSDDTGRVDVVAETADLAAQVLRDSIADATVGAGERPDEITIAFWHRTPRGARRVERAVDTEPWPIIRRNYADNAARAFDELVEVDAGSGGGRLLLLHGPPGTGKTTAIRSLGLAWREWCDLEVVIDPERLLGDASYLTEVLLGRDDDDDDDDGDSAGETAAKRWRLLVLEDCDELLRSTAKEGAGQNLSRLLNLADGLLGQGRRVLACLTTNEDLLRMHPAVTRPGRCLAQVHVGLLSRSEAATWLGPGSAPPAGPASVAELYATRTARQPITAPTPDTSAGTYL